LESSVSTDSNNRDFRYGFFLCYFPDKAISSDDKTDEKENWSRAVQCEIDEKYSCLTGADCSHKLGAVEMRFHIQQQKATDSVGREYLPPHVSQCSEWGRVRFFLTIFVTPFKMLAASA
uniref:PHM7_ext domain-containing protein n=1 Tax=Gongylonema pulchrum TaxID=637853 RepID=A0A183DMY7_9BILA